VEQLRAQSKETIGLLRSIPEPKGSYAYAPGKWTIKEIVAHVIDGERVFSYRALRFGRSDLTELPGFEQDDYVKHGGFAARKLGDLTDEFESVRNSTVHLFQGFDDEAMMRMGTAAENAVSVRALAYIIAGHELHHVKILRDLYLG
jgi:hypothetical protein